MNKQILEAFKFFYWFNSKVKYLPFENEKGSVFIKITKKKPLLYYYWSLSLGTFSVSIYLAVRLSLELFKPKASMLLAEIILHGFFFMVTIITDAFNLTLLWKGNEFTQLNNGGHNLDRWFKEKTVGLITSKEPKVDLIALWLKACIPISILNSIALALFSVLHRLGPVNRFIEECVPAYLATLAYYITPLTILVTFNSTFFCIMVVLNYTLGGIGYILVACKWLELLNKQILSYYSKLKTVVQDEDSGNGKKSKKPQWDVKKILECIQLVNRTSTIMNQMMNDHIIIVAPTFIAVAFLLTVLAIFANIKILSSPAIPIEYALFFPLLAFFLFMAEAAFIPNGAKMNEGSKEFIFVWGMLSHDNYMNRWMKSARPLRIAIGPFFYLERSTTFAFFEIVLNYSVDMLLTF